MAEVKLNYNAEQVKDYFYHDKCDKYDYLISVGCGAIAGLTDIFMVGKPTESRLGNWTDSQVDNVVRKFAKVCGWNPGAEKETNTNSAIGYLEKKFVVNYDQKNKTDVGGLFDMGTKNHHMKSLSHSPDIIGLFFSILNQFTSTSSFIDNGQLITIQTETNELQGGNFIAKLFCGVANWFGHIMSDVAGSSGSVNRGTGIVIPFYELFGLCDFGEFQVDNDRNTLAVVATKVFQTGYDARFGLTMAIPVVLCDLLIKLIWALKHYFYHKRPINECIPNKRHDDLRVMLIMGNGTLCLLDGADAAFKSGGNCVEFMLRLNLIAWFRLAILVLKEICIRVGISFPMQRQLEAFIRINEAVTQYLHELEQIDIERFIKETETYNTFVAALDTSRDENTLNKFLVEQYVKFGIHKPYEGDFDKFMNNPDSVLEFK